MKIGIIKGIEPVKNNINKNAVMKGIGIGLAAAVAITAATTAAVKCVASEGKGDKNGER